MSRFIAYCRVSTQGQVRDGISLEAQAERAASWAKAFDHTLVETISDEGLSGKDLSRPGIRRAIAMLDEGKADGLVIYDLSRLTRSVRDLVALVDSHFKDRFQLVSLSESIDTKSAAGRMMLNMLGIFAQFFRENAAEKTRDALQHLKAKGVRLGPPPFGLRRGVGGAFIDDPEEQAARACARGLRSCGWNLLKIATELNATGYQTRTGRPWNEKSVASILKP